MQKKHKTNKIGIRNLVPFDFTLRWSYRVRLLWALRAFGKWARRLFSVIIFGHIIIAARWRDDHMSEVIYQFKQRITNFCQTLFLTGEFATAWILVNIATFYHRPLRPHGFRRTQPRFITNLCDRMVSGWKVTLV